ncbi:endonuclease III [Nitrosovibrio sp. Nv6]|uniref:endonuclease III domain-containing protein n=1 Tax=Nitrosovibrio sp. Nv6 TaxID=1855340 RepID=UPI0008D6B5DE|nr:hypothetical protein [Nitrosovibrio sp. Nv6]SEO88415.1 A/G-specific adenine glycosylase [Nitrosovibrio sp. Nv6]
MNISKPPDNSVSDRRIALFRKKLLVWFPVNGRVFPWRVKGAGTYVLLVVEVLLQRTRAETVAAFLPHFLQRYSGWSAIASSNLDELAATLKPIGLWRRRSPALQGLAQELVAIGEKWPRRRDELEKITAVGQYLANATLLFIHGEPHPLMDSSMARLLRRYFFIRPVKADIRYDRALHAAAYRILASGHAIELNWAMLDIAASYCKSRKPLCVNCPLRQSCMHYRYLVKLR